MLQGRCPLHCMFFQIQCFDRETLIQLGAIDKPLIFLIASLADLTFNPQGGSFYCTNCTNSSAQSSIWSLYAGTLSTQRIYLRPIVRLYLERGQRR